MGDINVDEPTLAPGISRALFQHRVRAGWTAEEAARLPKFSSRPGKHPTAPPPTGDTKVCSRCREDLPLGQFQTRRSKANPNIRRPETNCKRCEAALAKESYAATKLKAVEYLGGSCINTACPLSAFEIAPVLFDFHHRDGKDSGIAKLLSKQRSWRVIEAELDKCDLLCVVCHRLHHAGLILPYSTASQPSE